MKNKITPQKNQSNIKNANKGTNGVNKQYAQNQGNRGKQLNPNQKKNKIQMPYRIDSSKREGVVLSSINVVLRIIILRNL